MKGQSATEYLMTYSWALVIIAVAVAALYALGVFSPQSLAASICSFPADFGCYSAVLLPNGNVVINLEQSTNYPINVTAIGCNDAGTNSNMVPVNSIAGWRGAAVINVEVGGNFTFQVPCYKSGSVFTGTVGQLYSGYAIVNYTDTETGFQHQVTGRLVQKVG